MDPAIHELVIVVVGDFTPEIINPSWLVHKKLIQEKEGDGAKVALIHPEVSRFKLGWAEFEVTRKRMSVKSSEESFFPIVRDLVISILKALKETPIEYLGINHVFHYEFSAKSYVDIGNALVPFKNWEKILKEPRLLKLEMLEDPRNDEYNGLYRVRVAPSELIRPFGVSININDHFNSTTKMNGASEIIELISNVWDRSVSKAKNVSNKIFQII